MTSHTHPVRSFIRRSLWYSNKNVFVIVCRKTAEFKWNIYSRIGIIHERCGLMIYILFCSSSFSDDSLSVWWCWWHIGHRFPQRIHLPFWRESVWCVHANFSLFKSYYHLLMCNLYNGCVNSLIHSDTPRMRFADQIRYQWGEHWHLEHAVFFGTSIIVFLSLIFFFSLSLSVHSAFGRFIQSITWLPFH